jgi:hypothetical protein
MAGKGSRYRRVDRAKFNAGWERLWGKRETVRSRTSPLYPADHPNTWISRHGFSKRVAENTAHCLDCGAPIPDGDMCFGCTLGYLSR